MSSASIGKAIRNIGWVFVAFYSLSYASSIYDTLNDPSVRAYAGLILFEGLLHIAGGLFVVWIGGLIRGKTTPPEAAPEAPTESKPD